MILHRKVHAVRIDLELSSPRPKPSLGLGTRVPSYRIRTCFMTSHNGTKVSCCHCTRIPSYRIHTCSMTYENCNTRILHLTAKLINLIYRRSQSLFTSATSKSPSSVVRYVFSSSVNLCFNATGYNSLFSDSHVKHYSSEDAYRASVIRALRLFGSASWSNELTITTLSSV